MAELAERGLSLILETPTGRRWTSVSGLKRKKQNALLSHEKGLQSSIRAWTVIVVEYMNVMASLSSGIDRALEGSDLSLIGGARAALLDVVKQPWSRRASRQAFVPFEAGVLPQLWPQPHPHRGIGVDDRRAIVARRQLHRLVKDLSQWEDVDALRRLHRRWGAVRVPLVDSLEDIALCGLPAGRCRWCPGAPGVRVRPLPAG